MVGLIRRAEAMVQTIQSLTWIINNGWFNPPRGSYGANNPVSYLDY